MYGYIYKTTNLIDGMIYIGQKHATKFLGNSYLGSGKLLIRAVNKYSSDNFIVELLEEVATKEEMDSREIYWIKFYNATDHSIGYNISEGGNVNRTMIGKNNPFYGKTHSAETVNKIKEANIGRVPWNKGLSKATDNRVSKYSDSLKGRMSACRNTTWINNGSISKMIKKDQLDKYLADDWKEGRLPIVSDKYGIANLGNIRIYKDGVEKNIKPDLLDQYLSEGWMKGRLEFKDTSKFGKHMQKAVICIETNIKYDSVKAAAIANNVAESSISACCRGKRKTVAKLHWRYE